MFASDIILRVRDLVVDPDAVRWTDLEMLRWIGDGQKFIIHFRPDSTSVSEVIALGAGSKQVLPPSSLRLLDINNAVKPDGTPANAVTLVDRQILDSQVPGWQGAKPTLLVQHYVYDNRVPNEFRVCPPAVAGAKLDISTSKEPVDPTYANDRLSLFDAYRDMLVSYVCHRCYCKDTEARSDRAAMHLGALSQALGIKLQKDAAFQPSMYEKGATPHPAALSGGGI